MHSITQQRPVDGRVHGISEVEVFRVLHELTDGRVAEILTKSQFNQSAVT